MMRQRGETEDAAYARTSLAIANLRGVFIIILVSFHSCLAYLSSTAAPPPSFSQPPYPWLEFPIVDDRRFFGFDIYCAWEDVHVMALMFFVSGLFVSPSLARKGALRFTGDRLLRLGLPFLFNVLVLMPIAVYAIFLSFSPGASLADYIAAYLALPFLPNGPTWFLWLLLGWSCLAALLYGLWPASLDWLAAAVSGARTRPQWFLAGLFVAVAIGYLPPTLAYNPFDWFVHGLLSFQISRPLLYGAFFFAGIAIGAHGLGAGLLAPDGALGRHWRDLAFAAPLTLFVWMGLTGVTLTWPTFWPLTTKILSALAYLAASVAGVMTMIALSVRFATTRIRWLEPFSRNSLGIFVVHYAPLVWTQYWLTGAPLPALLKALIVFLVTMLLSLGAVLAMRRQPLLARLVGEVSSDSRLDRGLDHRERDGRARSRALLHGGVRAFDPTQET